MNNNLNTSEQQFDQSIAQKFTRVFSHRDAEDILAHLNATTRDPVFGPHVSSKTLRYIEGQRALVAYITRMIERGRNAP